MKITITQSDLEAARKDHEVTGMFFDTCLVYQALKRSGIPVRGVGYESCDVAGGDIHRLKNTGDITRASSENWDKFVGCEFEFLEIPEE